MPYKTRTYVFFKKTPVYFTKQKDFEKYTFSIIKRIKHLLNVSRIILIQKYLNLTEFRYFYQRYNFFFVSFYHDI
jgi:hypothetical protein